LTNSVALFAQSHPRDSSGAFLPTVKAYDRLLEYESVRSWIGNYTAPMRAHDKIPLKTDKEKEEADQIAKNRRYVHNRARAAS